MSRPTITLGAFTYGDYMQQLDLPFNTVDSLREEISEIKIKYDSLRRLHFILETQMQATCTHPKDAVHKELQPHTRDGSNNRVYITSCYICGKQMDNYRGSR